MIAPILHIRIADREDVPVLAAMGKSTFWDTYSSYHSDQNFVDYTESAFTPEVIAREMEEEDCTFFLVEDRQIPVAYMKLRRGRNPECLPPDVSKLEIQRLYVLREWQGKQIGGQLIRHALDTALSEQRKIVWLTAWPQNEPAIRFYQRQGFAVSGTIGFVMKDLVEQDYVMSVFV